MAKKKQALSPEERLAAALVPEEEWPYALPDGWKWVRLGKIYDVNPKVQADDDLEASFVTMSDISPGIKSQFDFIVRKWGEIKKGHTQFANGDVAFAKISPCFENRKSMILDGLKNGIGAGTTELIVLRNPSIDNKYTFLFISSEEFIRHARNTYKGVVGQQRINLDFVKNYPMPLPPLSEQRRLVARIESLFAKLDAAREKVQSVLDSHETRKAALLHDAFTGKLTAKWREEHGISLVNWQTRSLSDCGTWKGGGTPSKAHPDYWENGEIMWVTSKDMKSDKIQDTQMHITPLGVEQSSAIYSEKPAVLFVTRSGILRHTLPVALVNRPFTTNQDLKSLTPNENIDTQYLFFAAKAFSGQILKTCMKNGTTVESINTKKLMEFLLPIASMREQKVIAKMLRQLLNKEQRARQAAEETLAAIDRMKQSILARAFRGEL